MSESYVGEIRMFGGNFAPQGWRVCDGSLLPISENETLFNLIGTTYGGDGQSTFAIPNLQGRMPAHMGQGAGLPTRYLGETGGVEAVTIDVGSTPSHNHQAIVSTSSGTSNNANGNVAGASPNLDLYLDEDPTAALNPQALLPSQGGTQPHENVQPYQAVNFIISLYGVFPPPF